MFDFDYARQVMIDRQLVSRGISDKSVLKAMRQVARERFVTEGQEEFAYEDSPLGIGEGQTISQPYIVARMIEAAELEAGNRVLEVGTGSGYAAAVMSRIAARVFTIERHRGLGEQARTRLDNEGYRNVIVRIGDGSCGWSEEAPFDTILVAASGPSVPMALQEQLEIGGRLVMPIGDRGDEQRLLRITRVSASRYEEEDLGGVLFVPLIGEHGWPDKHVPKSRRSLPERIAAAMEPLPLPEDTEFGAAFDRFADRRVILLGEASHGTSEFYRARAAITKRLIEQHGFSIIAVEADWPDAATINRHIRGLSVRSGKEPPFQRFPAWMWRNKEMSGFLTWLRQHNAARIAERQAGFYGLDLYNMSDSIASVLAYLEGVDENEAALARERYGCLTPWQNDPATYGRAALSSTYRSCEAAVVAQCRDLLQRRLQDTGTDGEDFLDATQSARLVASAEKYYRVMYYGGAASWNLRDRHMFETLEQLLETKGSSAKAVVWAHNSHIGDARKTEMGEVRDELNLGQLCREGFGHEVALIGFGTHTGTVAAATDWDGEMEIKVVRPSRDDSVEHCFHLAGRERALLDFARFPELSRELERSRLERFIGVIYRPETERHSHYAQASLSRQFDAYVWFEHTEAVDPIGHTSGAGQGADTFPFGL